MYQKPKIKAVVPRNCLVAVSPKSERFYSAWTSGLINYFNGEYITERITAKRIGLQISGYNVRN